MGKSAAELRAYVDGNDPLTGRPVMQEVIEALTNALRNEAPGGLSAPRRASSSRTPKKISSGSSSRITGPTSCRSFCRPRTGSRRCSRHTSHEPDEVVGHMQPTANRGLWEYTVEKVAVNAVMSGARPEYFPVILALAAIANLGAQQQLQLGRGDGGGERPDPPRDRHELRHRRDGPL